jgi:hypothetical protein
VTDTDPAPPPDPSLDQKLSALKTEILDAVKSMLGHGHAGSAPSTTAASPAAQPQDLQTQIDAAVAKVQQDQAAKSAADQHAAEHEALKAAAAEKPPMERKGVHRLMGWGEPSK